MEQAKLNYGDEVKKLQENATATWFKPTAGTYKCRVTVEPWIVKNKNFGTEEKPDFKDIFRVPMLANGTEVTWDMSLGVSYNSAYGQLMLLGNKNGKLKDVEFTLLVKSAKGKDNKQKNEYTIIEAVDLIPKK